MSVSLWQLTESAVRSAGSSRPNEKEVYGRAQPTTQGINRGHDGAPVTTKGRLAGFHPQAAGAVDARRREGKAQPKVAAKAAKPAVKAKSPAKPATKAAARPAAR